MIAGNIAAAAGQRLGKRPHPDINLIRVNTEMLMHAMAARANHAKRMRLIHHQPGIMAARNLNEARQIGDIAIHRVMTLNHQKPPPCAAPRIGQETDHRTLPHEVGWIGPAVPLSKGCYRGQEAVARVHNLGRPPRRLALVHLDGSEEVLPAHGDPVMLDGAEIGWVASAVRHYEVGPLATVVVRRSTPDGATVIVRHGETDIAGTMESVVA